MKRRDLEQLRALRKEIESLEYSLREPRPSLVTISYKDYATGKGVPKSDVGYDDGEEEQNRLTRILKKKRKELEEKVAEILEWIDAIEDPEMRAIIWYYYSEGLSQEDVAERMFYDRRTIGRKLKNFWKYVQ